MSTPTASPALRHAPRATPHRWLRFAGPAAAAVLAGLAVGRFLTVGAPASRDAGRPVTAAAPVVDEVTRLRNEGIAAVHAAIRTGDPTYYGQATTALDAALRLDPGDASTLAAQAVLALSVHDFTGALALAERAVAANPLSTTALAALVDAHVETGRYADAEAALGRLLDADPGVAAFARVSYLRQLSGDLAGAEVAMRQAVAAAASGADRALVLTYLGDIQLERGAIDAAGDAYRAALLEQPRSVLAELGSARVRIARGDLVGAARALDELVMRSPQPAVATVRGELALLMGDATAAASNFELVAANEQILRSEGVTTDLESALFLADHGDPHAAVAAARSAYEARRTVFTADALAWALVRAGDATAAVALAEEALSGGLRTPSVRVHAAAAFAAVGDVDRARHELRVAFEGQPWLSLSVRGTAVDLGSTLGVEVPEGWRP